MNQSRNKREGKFHGKHGCRINRDHFKKGRKIHSASWQTANRKQKKLLAIMDKHASDSWYDY